MLRLSFVFIERPLAAEATYCAFKRSEESAVNSGVKQTTQLKRFIKSCESITAIRRGLKLGWWVRLSADRFALWRKNGAKCANTVHYHWLMNMERVQLNIKNITRLFVTPQITNWQLITQQPCLSLYGDQRPYSCFLALLLTEVFHVYCTCEISCLCAVFNWISNNFFL